MQAKIRVARFVVARGKGNRNHKRNWIGEKKKKIDNDEHFHTVKCQQQIDLHSHTIEVITKHNNRNRGEQK